MGTLVYFLIAVISLSLAWLLIRGIFKDTSQKIREAQTAIEAGDFRTAQAILENIVAEDDENIRAHYYLAVIFDKTKERKKALMELRKCLTLGKFNEEVSELAIRQKTLEILLHEGMLKDAFKECRALQKIDPGNPRYAYEMGIISIKWKEFNEATLELFHQAAATDPNLPRINYYQGLVHWRLEDKEQARLAFTKEIEGTGQENPEAHCFLGLLYLERGQYADAVKAFEQGTKSREMAKTAFFGLGKALYQLREYHKALDPLEQSVHRQLGEGEKDTDTEALYLLGCCQENLEDFGAALNWWERVLLKDPNYLDAREKTKKYSIYRMDDIVVELNTAANDVFKTRADQILSKLKYNVLEILIQKNGNLSMIAKETEGEKRLTCLIFLRNVDHATETEIANLKRFMFENRAKKGVLMTTGEFSVGAEELAANEPIELINHLKLADILHSLPPG